jgi:proteasome activator subunit 4
MDVYVQSSVLQDKLSVGWYSWPDEYSVYMPRTDDKALPRVDAASQDAFNKFIESFGSSEFWPKLMTFMSQESTRDRDDNFSVVNAHLFKSIFQMYEDQFLDYVKPELAKMCAISEKNQQRAAAELLAGLIRGSKHWKLSSSRVLWEWVIPLLEKTFSTVTPDSLIYWEKFLGYCCVSIQRNMLSSI